MNHNTIVVSLLALGLSVISFCYSVLKDALRPRPKMRVYFENDSHKFVTSLRRSRDDYQGNTAIGIQFSLKVLVRNAGRSTPAGFQVVIAIPESFGIIGREEYHNIPSMKLGRPVLIKRQKYFELLFDSDQNIRPSRYADVCQLVFAVPNDVLRSVLYWKVVTESSVFPWWGYGGIRVQFDYESVAM